MKKVNRTSRMGFNKNQLPGKKVRNHSIDRPNRSEAEKSNAGIVSLLATSEKVVRLLITRENVMKCL